MKFLPTLAAVLSLATATFANISITNAANAAPTFTNPAITLPVTNINVSENVASPAVAAALAATRPHPPVQRDSGPALPFG